MTAAAATGFLLERVDVPGGTAGWQGMLHRAGTSPVSVRFLTDGKSSGPPELLDGLAIALLPTAMRVGGSLHVRGPMTRGALRNLTEYAEAWANWRPTAFRPVTITADRVIDGLRPPFDGDALFAWSGGLRSTHTLVRHRDRLVPGAFGVRAAVRIVGLEKSASDTVRSDGEEDAFAALRAEGIEAIVVRTDARRRGVIDPEIGVLPIVAAALHAVSAGSTIGVHARSWDLIAQQRFPRPDPALADLLGGDAFVVRADGGSTSPPAMVAALVGHPALAAVVSDCRRVPKPSHPCGRCAGCTLLALAFAARGLPSPRSRRRLSVPGVVGLPFRDPIIAADATATLDDWAGPPRGWRSLLRARVGLNRAVIDVRDHLRWAGACVGLLPPWPR